MNETVTDESFDFVVVGSGFGGSVSAMRLTEKGYRVLVLERGKRFTARDFPRTNWHVPKFLWLPALRCFGIMGINFLDDIMILNGSGVGGGSLVYASTHIKPGRAFFEAEEWRDLADWEAELAPYYELADRMLGTAVNPRLTTADKILYDLAVELGREQTFRPTPVGIFFGEEGSTVQDPYFEGEGPERTGCVFCGGCMVGCRHNAKNTLDKNYLYFAEKWGAEIRAESEVVDIRPLPPNQPDDARYEIVYRSSTAWLFKPRQVVRARNVVISAGVLGTVDLLLRLRDETGSLPRLSRRLGQRVRSNSEALMGVTARRSDPGRNFSEGVAITSHFWIDDETSVEPVRYSRGSSLMRFLAVPLVSLEGGVLQRFVRFLAYAVKRPYDLLKVLVLPHWAEDSTILLIMQTAENRMSLTRGRSFWTWFRRGLVSYQDQRQPIPAVINAGRQVVELFASRIDGIAQSTSNEVLLNKPSTAHILGGCGIGPDASRGVIDIDHQVFNYPGLYVADASAIPANLGVNPSLTITAMTERAMSRITALPEAERRRRANGRLTHPAPTPAQAERTLAGRLARLLPLLALPLALLAAGRLWRRRS